MTRLAAALAAFLLGCAFIFPPHGGGVGSSSSSSIALTRTFNNPTGTATGSNQFWMIGQPFISGPTKASAGLVSQTPDVPSGNIFTATLGGTAVRVAACQRKLDSDGSLAWSQVMVDMTGAAIAGSGGSATLQLTSTPGSWSSATNATDTDWEALGAQVVIGANLMTTTSASNGDMNSGPYTAKFDGGASNSIVTICDSPLGREVMVTANFVNGSSVAHCYLQARMWFWVTQNSSGGHGVANSPIAFIGPLIDNTQVFKNGSNGCDSGDEPGIFDYDAVLSLNGGATVVRGGTGSAYSDITHIAQTEAWMGRPDGQWDWDCGTNAAPILNGSCAPIYGDPGLYVTQDYTKVAATYKFPAIVHGISYAGTTCDMPPTTPITGVSGATFTAAGGIGGLTQLNGTCGIQGSYHPPTSIEFTGSLSGLGGMSLGTTYWLSYVSGNLTTSGSFEIYQTEAEAEAGGSTGLITPTGTYSGSGLVAEMDAAPENIGLGYLVQQDGGNRVDLSLFSFWGMGYLVASSNIPAVQREARTLALSMTALPVFAIDQAKGTIPSLLDSADTPSGLTNMAGGTGMTSSPSDWWYPGHAYANINGNNGPTPITGGSGLATQTGLWAIEQEHFPGSSIYPVWLMEGNPALQWVGVGLGHANLAQLNPGYRGFTATGIGTFTGVPVVPIFDERTIGWIERNVGEAAFMATGGSAEETYFRSQLTDAQAYLAALNTYQGTNATNFGLFGWAEAEPPGTGGNTFDGPYGSNFMTAYTAVSFGLAAMLNGNSASINSAANNIMKLFMDEWNEFCPYFGDVYNPVPQTADANTAVPGAYAPLADLGFGLGESGSKFIFSFSGNTVTSTNFSGWTSYAGTVVAPFATNDLVRFQNQNSDGGPATPGPSQVTDGQTYYIYNPSGATFQISTTPNGANPVGSFTTTTGVGGVMTPGPTTNGVNCPSSGLVQGDPTADNDYPTWSQSALAIAAERGVDWTSLGIGSAASAYSAAAARITATFGGDPTWAFANAP